MSHHHHHPDDNRARVELLLSYLAVPKVWRAMTLADWVKAGWWVTVSIGDEDHAREVIREHHPAWADQADAAEAEAHKLAEAIQLPGTVRATAPPDFQAECALRGHALRILAGIAGGELARCAHAEVWSPRPLFAAAWGDRVDCERCFAFAPAQERPEVDQHICDLCGRYQSRRVALATPTLGMLTIGMGICAQCIARMVDQ